MGLFLTEKDLKQTEPAEVAAYRSPIPTQVISNGEFAPPPQTELQLRFEHRVKELASALGKRQGLGRRQFLKTACGMAAAFVAMNDVFGSVFTVGQAEAADPAAAAERARSLAHQFIFDDQVHFLRDDTKLERFVGLRNFTGKALNPALAKEPQTIQHLKFGNFVKEVFFDSDTTVALLSGAPSDNPGDWFLSNDQKAAAREAVNRLAGSRRLLCHAVFTPGQPGWLDEIDRAITQLKPDAWKGYTIGDPTSPSRFPWRLDDEKLVYPAYEKMLKAGITNVCIHKGILPPNADQAFPGVWQHGKVDDLPKAAKDWPQLNFIIYHAAYRPLPGPSPQDMQRFEQTGYLEWVSDLAEIPAKHGLSNVYAEVGAAFALTCVTHPRYCAGLMGTLIKGLGAAHVLWGTDSVWFGSPQWQIEALRRLEIPEDLQKKFGYAALGPADGMVKSAIFGFNAARLYKLQLRNAQLPGAYRDKLAQLKADYEKSGPDRSNAAYGYVHKRA